MASTVGIIEGFTSAVGEELSEMAGFRSTRTTAQVLAETQVQTEVNTLTYSGALTVTIPGVFNVGIVAGNRLRILSGAKAGKEAIVASRDSDTQLTLLSVIDDATPFSGVSWEVVVDAATSLPVESTLGWGSSGRLVVDGRVYNYSSKTIASFDGITYDDGTGTIITGFAQTHIPLLQVDDYSQRLSAFDKYRDSFLVNYAVGDDLSVLGNNLGFPRPPEIEDDTVYRNLLKAVVYSPRGTIYALELGLTALLGAGNFSIFQNLTSGSPLREACKVFVARDDAADSEEYVGKAWVDGYQQVALDSGTQLTVSPNDVLNTASVRLADDTTPLLIAEGASAASADSGVTITGPASAFPAYIFPGDIFELTESNLKGRRGVVLSRDSDTQLTLGFANGTLGVGTNSNGSIGVDFPATGWRILREKHDFRHYLPSVEQILVDGTPTNTWTYVGGGAEGTYVTTYSAGFGKTLGVSTGDAIDGGGGYARNLNIEPTSNAVFEINTDTVNTLASDVAGSALQQTMLISDGERTFGFGVIRNGSEIEFGLINPVTGSFLGSGEPWLILDEFLTGYRTIRIEKNGRGSIRLLSAWHSPTPESMRLIEEVPYTSFPTVAAWQGAAPYAAGTNEIVFGGFYTPAVDSITSFNVKWVDVHVSNTVDYFNTQAGTGTTVNPNGLTASSNPFLAGDVGKFITIKDFSAISASGGNSRGTWEIASVTPTNACTVVGPTRFGGLVSLVDPFRFTTPRDSKSFRFPDHLDHSIEILNGPNAGVYPIAGIIDEVTDAPVGTGRPQLLSTISQWTSAGAINEEISANEVLLDTAAGSPSRPAGLVPTGDPINWRIVPNFAPDADVDFEIAGTGTETGGVITLRTTSGLSVGTMMGVYYSLVESAYLFDETVSNTLTLPDSYSIYPFYLHDSFGAVRTAVDILTVAGVELDFDRYYVDPTGEHLVP